MAEGEFGRLDLSPALHAISIFCLAWSARRQMLHFTCAFPTNTLYHGDNLKILRDQINDESVDLVYLDPPSNSNRAEKLSD
jgi:16S rRNA G966 N2-methylase RsmD